MANSNWSVSPNYNVGPLKNIEASMQREKWLCENKWDTIVTGGRQIPGNVKYMVVDLETHDWKHTAKSRYDTGRMVEIAWKLFSDEGNCLESKQYLVKPYGPYKKIDPKATSIHGITDEHVSKYGIEVDLVLGEFVDIVKNIPADGFVIAHNMDHEHTVLTNSLSPDLRIVWNEAPKSDTHSTDLLLDYLPREAKLENKKRLGLIPLVGFRLQQLHECIHQGGGRMYDYVHFAETDVGMTWDIFRYYQRLATVEELTYQTPVFIAGVGMNFDKKHLFLSRSAQRIINLKRAGIWNEYDE